ncbi:hypothetical protein BKA70DRAFT_1527329 [Coprinopsis sp. MPI-PUGE-AT-0042]|nr:hypothetical protein BKA70DRAFT_1527329 [Coprinopsis sp. MPI-PUGE-AT-0042]
MSLYSSFKPINLHFLKHTLRFLTISIWYHRAITSNDDSGILGDVVELCKQLSCTRRSARAANNQMSVLRPSGNLATFNIFGILILIKRKLGGQIAEVHTNQKQNTAPSPTIAITNALKEACTAAHGECVVSRWIHRFTFRLIFYLIQRNRTLSPAPSSIYTSSAFKRCQPLSLVEFKNIDYYKEWIGLDSFLTSKISLDNASLNGHTSKPPPPRMAPKPKPSFDKLSSSLSLGDTFGHKTKRSFKSLKMLRVEFVAERGEAQKEVEELERHAKSVEKWMGRSRHEGLV